MTYSKNFIDALRIGVLFFIISYGVGNCATYFGLHTSKSDEILWIALEGAVVFALGFFFGCRSSATVTVTTEHTITMPESEDSK